MHGPSPETLYPLPGFPQAIFLKNFITRPNIEVGDYSYYDDPDGAERFEERNVLHHFDFYGDRLVIGRFVAIAAGTRFIMNGANHAMGGFSPYPFNIFQNGWERGFDPQRWISQSRGDTVVGNDVWIGMDSLVMPGVRIGDGAIVAANSTVVGDVPPFAVVGGNPARVIRTRFDEATVARLLDIAWWNWSAERITASLDAIRGNDLAALEACAEDKA
ncbi:CatB-related O-acetyltransferase [Notoacmeibacter ruber]|uniref:Antibiotic acetyltransferase n=1 Tax=Notoacmeibacter ruber TaxID=2670375 RepID=A0A3L7JF20_9HYPH|nr:CatB-related O-acetyltransferase [Notoacmeibacter ruber]RLQ87072.1 antibiotic acetyltransferase [Notoacmeibacter ruber]